MENSKKNGLSDDAMSDITSLLNASIGDNLDIDMELEKITRDKPQ